MVKQLINDQVDKKRLLLESGAKLFMRRGYFGTHVYQIHELSGLDLKDFKENFPEKSFIFEELIDKSFKFTDEVLLPVTLDKELSPKEKIKLFMQNVRNYLLLSKANRLLLISANEMPVSLKEKGYELEEYFKRWHDMFSILANCSYCNVDILVRRVFSHLVGGTLISHVLNDESFVLESCDHIAHCLLSTYEGAVAMSDFRELISDDIWHSAVNGDPKAKFEIGMLALRHHRLGYAELFLNEAKMLLVG